MEEEKAVTSTLHCHKLQNVLELDNRWNSNLLSVSNADGGKITAKTAYDTKIIL